MWTAIREATEGARGDFAAALDAELTQETQAFADTLSDAMAERFTAARTAAADTLAARTSPGEKEVYQRDDGTWHAFVLMERPVAEAAKALLARLEKQEALRPRFRESPAYQELTEGAKEMKARDQER